MKFAILGSRGFPSSYSGYETLVRRLAPALAEEGHQVTVYSRERVAGSRVWSEQGVRCIATAGYRSKSLSTLTFGLTGTLDAARRGFDAVLVLNIANGYWLPLLRARRIPAALNTDGLEWVRGKWGPVARRVFRGGAWAAARFSDQLIADSREIASIWRERFGVTSTFIPYGADVCNDRDASRLAGLGLEKDGYFLVVARMVPENSVGLTLDALEQVSATGRLPLVLVGTGDPGSALLQRLRRAHAKGSVRWLGHVADQALLTELWTHCAVYVHGHSVGGTNPSLLQALGAGAPTLALDTPFNREVIRSREQLYPPDARCLAAMVERLASSPELQRQFGLRGQQIVDQHYRWGDVTRMYGEVLLQLAEGRR
jgi:glycosyltransferase involved in cell wall biosynthesis